MDILSKILDALRFNGTFYYSTNFSESWSIRVPSYKRVARFHYVTQGNCWVKIDSIPEPQQLCTGDLIIIPHGASHILCDNPDTPPISLEKAYEHSNYQGEGVFEFGNEKTNHDTQLVCGHFEFEDVFQHPLIEHLPEYIIQNENMGGQNSWLKDTLRFMEFAAKSRHEGSVAIIKRLSEVIFIQTVRLWHSARENQEGFMAALQDPQISKGLKAFHDNPSENWTVERLAEASLMSRSLFSERFKQFMAISPMQYVTQWRMQNAQQLLTESELSIDQIANHVGYDSLAAFSKAFKRVVSQNPGEYRRSSKAALQHLTA